MGSWVVQCGLSFRYRSISSITPTATSSRMGKLTTWLVPTRSRTATGRALAEWDSRSSATSRAMSSCITSWPTSTRTIGGTSNRVMTINCSVNLLRLSRATASRSTWTRVEPRSSLVVRSPTRFSTTRWCCHHQPMGPFPLSALASLGRRTRKSSSETRPATCNSVSLSKIPKILQLNLTSTALKDFARPIAWTKDLWNLDRENDNNNGLQNEDLIVWMRTAALPSFRKLYRRVDFSQKSSLDGKLPKGDYTLDIDYSKS